MTLPRTVYVCQACGHQSTKWLGCCPECDGVGGAWSRRCGRLRRKRREAGRSERARACSRSGRWSRSRWSASRAESRCSTGCSAAGSSPELGAARRRPGHRQVDPAAAGGLRAVGEGRDALRHGEESVRSRAARAAARAAPPRRCRWPARPDSNGSSGGDADAPEVLRSTSIQTACTPSLDSLPGSLARSGTAAPPDGTREAVASRLHRRPRHQEGDDRRAEVRSSTCRHVLSSRATTPASTGWCVPPRTASVRPARSALFEMHDAGLIPLVEARRPTSCRGVVRRTRLGRGRLRRRRTAAAGRGPGPGGADQLSGAAPHGRGLGRQSHHPAGGGARALRPPTGRSRRFPQRGRRPLVA